MNEPRVPLANAETTPRREFPGQLASTAVAIAGTACAPGAVATAPNSGFAVMRAQEAGCTYIRST